MTRQPSPADRQLASGLRSIRLQDGAIIDDLDLTVGHLPARQSAGQPSWADRPVSGP